MNYLLDASAYVDDAIRANREGRTADVLIFIELAIKELHRAADSKR
jgi:hypothetical protein